MNKQPDARPRPQPTTTLERVRDMAPLDRRLTIDEVANRLQIMKNDVIISFCSLDHAFSNYDERKTDEMHFQSKPYI
jgi:hypothetical protein